MTQGCSCCALSYDRLKYIGRVTGDSGIAVVVPSPRPGPNIQRWSQVTQALQLLCTLQGQTQIYREGHR